jgi:tetratricopeptide (TPR) repeat protein
MLRLLAPLAFAIGATQVLPDGDAPRTVVRAAARAVEADSEPRLRAALSARVARNPNDRAALLGLATLARLRYDYPAAESSYRRLLSELDDRYAVYAHLGLAEGFEARSASQAALPEFGRALSAARRRGDRTAEGRALVFLSIIRGHQEGVRTAEALLDTAARVLPDSAFDVWSLLRGRRAVALALHGRAADASREADVSVDLARRARDVDAEADAFRIVGQILQYRGAWDTALVALRRSQDLYQRARDRSALATSLIWHAQVLGGLGRYGEEREVMQRALVEGEATHNPGAKADAHRAFGALAQMLGDWPAAASHLRQAAAISATSGDSSSVMITRKCLANVALATGDLAMAKRLTLEQLGWTRGVADPMEQYEAQQTLAGIAIRERDWATAEKALGDARRQLSFIPGDVYRAWLTHAEARMALARGDLALAERLLRAFLDSKSKALTGDTRFDARVRLADVYARRGDVARTERELVTAAEEIERWRAQLSDAELRALAFQVAATENAAATEPTALPAGTARALAVLAGGGRAEAAFALAERWRARELMDRLTRIAALRTAEPERSGQASLPAATPRTAADVMAAIPDDHTALVEYVVADGAPITVFVVQRGGVAARVLPPFDSLGAAVRRFTALVESGLDAAPFGRRLGSTLVDPALALLRPGVTRVIVVPDGPLHRLPFDALRSAGGRYLVERYALGTAPSASALLTLWARPRAAPAGPVRLLALGDAAVPVAPRDTTDAAEAGFFAAARAAGALERLSGAAREARLVARYAPATDVRLGRDASAAFLEHADLRDYRVLHFATHAVVDERSVAGTALALAPGAGKTGFVGASDLAALNLRADLVVLSACRSAGGVVVGGEGMQGLTAPLLAAGARSLVATQWRIDDREVVPVVDAFYTALATGQPVIDALRAAKLRALGAGRSPRAWAAFSVIGDPLVTVPLRAPPAHWWSLLGW